jgi:proteasome lid subunit RPN8/RPN11
MIDIPPSIRVQNLGMKCRISRQVLHRCASEASRSPGLESCGLLLGQKGWVREAVALPNRSPDPARAFGLDPEEQLHASRELRQQGHHIVGHYHSHPGGSAVPSRTDADHAERQGVYWLIVTSEEQRLWISRPGGRVEGAFEPVVLEVDETTALQP